LDETDPSVSVTIRLPSKQMIDLCAQAHKERRTLPDLIRYLLKSENKTLK
jgi:hypothetical protein